tara:strand:- start:608 stop:1012 length:405 start_codon:yes stop_codon:yes gene_type:complete
MKIKLLLICLLFVTPQVFAETKSIQKLNNPDPIYVLERCAANSFSLLQLLESMKNKGKEEMDFQKVITKRFNFFVGTLINYHQDQNKNLSKDEVSKKIFTRIADLVKTVSKDIEKPYFNEDMAYCKSIVKYKKK